MFENLSERLERSFKILKGEGKITEINVAETMKDVRRALLDADVSYKVAKEFCDRVKDKAVNPDLIELVEETPDTVVAFTTGRKIIVKESRQDIKNLVKSYRKDVFAQ